MDPCPTPETLERLLSPGLSEAEAARLRAHASGCPRCQAALDRQSDDPELRRWASAGRAFLTEDAEDA